jgi:uncharacterized protein YjaG (DUF416 family)
MLRDAEPVDVLERLDRLLHSRHYGDLLAVAVAVPKIGQKK